MPETQTEKSGKTRQSPASSRQQDEVFRSVRRDILSGRFRPRERLVEEDLIQRFAAGRYAVRSALDELVRIGLAVRRPNRGVIVYDYDPIKIAKLYEMRDILHRAAIERLVLPAQTDLLQDLREINRSYAVALDRGELDEVAEANALFHQRLFSACDNEYLVESIEQFRERTAVVHGYAVGVPELARQSHMEHEMMIDCLEQGDRAALLKLCIEHVLPALEAVGHLNGVPINAKHVAETSR